MLKIPYSITVEGNVGPAGVRLTVDGGTLNIGVSTERLSELVEFVPAPASNMTGQEEQPATTYELVSRGLTEYRTRDGTHYWATPHDAGKLMALMAKEPWPTRGETRHSGAMP